MKWINQIVKAFFQEKYSQNQRIGRRGNANQIAYEKMKKNRIKKSAVKC